MTHKSNLAVLCLSTLITGSALAAVTPQDAARLGQDLTPTGAERAGNTDGSIPAWDPANLVVPEGFEPFSGDYPNPYADEKPLFVIDGSNWQEDSEYLTDGTRAIFEKLGNDGFKMNVYPTRRSASNPQRIYDATKKVAATAKPL